MPYLGNVPAEAYTNTVKDSFNGDASTTAFTLSQPSTANNLRVVVENVIQDPTVAYSVSGTTLTFTSAPPVGTANIYAVHLGPAVQTAVPPSEINNATTYTSDLTVQGAFTSQGIDDNATSTAMTVDSNGNVGIGVAPTFSAGGSRKLFQITNGASGGQIAMSNNSNESENPRIFSDANNLGFATATTGGGIVQFYTGGSERARISDTGALLIHKTSPDQAVEGMEFAAGNYLLCTKSGGTTAYFNRTTSNGTIVEFRKDGTTVGNIGCAGSGSDIITIYNSSSANGCGLGMYNNQTVRPVNNSGTDSDNQVDLGRSATRFNDAFITNGVTTGSDANEKQQISVLTDAEIAAAKRISAGFKTFKWNDAVEAKGDNARTHTGVIAQEVQAALEAEGLNAGNYAFWMSNTWWEADETYTNDDGVEQTRTNTYDTLEEAPAGAVERTRLGIRYPELLAFIGAATEQRLTSIEARLATLENA